MGADHSEKRGEDKHPSVSIRHATPADAAQIREIYAPYVRETAITFEYEVPSVEEFRKRIENTLKNYPEVEKLWHLHKNRKMRLFINDWYNQLREIWGLEKLELASAQKQKDAAFY